MADAWGPPKKLRKPSASSQPKITPPSTPEVPSGSPSTDDITNKLLNNPDAMSKIEKLRNNPTMQEILQDPELVQAIREKDLARIASDPKIKALESNKNLQDLLKQNQ